MIERREESGVCAVRWVRDGIEEVHVTGVPSGTADPRSVLERSAASAAATGASVAAQEIFGEAGGAAAVPWPVMRLGGGPGTDGFAGTQLLAVAGTSVRPVALDGRPVGTVYEDAHARWCRLADIRSDPSRPREEQARDVFLRMERALEGAGMGFGDVVRTWLYIDDILAWYGAFNAARTAFFAERKVFDGLVPASTGIGSPNPAGAAVAAGALAVRPKDGSVRAAAVPSPLQCPAPAYGSSFSRAVEIAGPGWRRLLVSGTASIAPGGASIHPGDVRKQADLTLDVVGAILESRGMGWNDATRAIAYVRHRADVPVLAERCAHRSIPALPAVVFESVICRADLLFELELDAAGR